MWCLAVRSTWAASHLRTEFADGTNLKVSDYSYTFWPWIQHAIPQTLDHEITHSCYWQYTCLGLDLMQGWLMHMDVAHWLVPCEEKYKMESAGEALAESFSVSNDFFNSCLLPRCFLTFLRNLWAHFMTWKLVKRTTWLGLQRAGALGSLFVISRYCTLSCRYFQRQLVFLLVVASH